MSAKDEERAANTDRMCEQRVALPVSERDEEGSANTDRRSKQRIALPVSTKDEEGAANTDRRSKQGCVAGRQKISREQHTLTGGVNRELRCQ